MTSPELSELISGPVLLAPDNFTSLARTPWAGSAIARLYKDVITPGGLGRKIGESWEFSCDPAYPSRVVGTSLTLAQLVEQFPKEILSKRHAEKNRHGCELLVKLVNADEPLSLQVHPRDGDPGLKPNESGKPESWLVLHAEKGAGLYLGFKRPVTRAEVQKLISTGQEIKGLLHFVAVKPGDYFEIEPGVPHAIGPGVTLLEPQRIGFTNSGKTYRLWDWGRLYDESGRVDMEHGKPRPLHLEEGLKLIDPEAQVGDAFVDSVRRQPRVTSTAGATTYAYQANSYYQTSLVKISAQATYEINLKDTYAALVMLGGEVVCRGKNGNSIVLRKGQPCLLPHAAMPLTLGAATDAELALVAAT